MNNKTLETLTGTASRLEAALEVDKELEGWQKKAIQRIIFIITGLLAGTNENKKES